MALILPRWTLSAFSVFRWKDLLPEQLPALSTSLTPTPVSGQITPPAPERPKGHFSPVQTGCLLQSQLVCGQAARLGREPYTSTPLEGSLQSSLYMGALLLPQAQPPVSLLWDIPSSAPSSLMVITYVQLRSISFSPTSFSSPFLPEAYSLAWSP